jgi:U3 small nucleolar RNA-associated protein 18
MAKEESSGLKTATATATKKSRNPYARRDPDLVPEKDDTEKALEKLLFGDDEGFYGALKQHRGLWEDDGALVPLGGASDEDEKAKAPAVAAGAGEEDGDVDMDGVADEDVCFTFRLPSNPFH